MTSRAGKALILALFSVTLADCGSRSGVEPKQVDARALQSTAADPHMRAFYQARQWQAAWDGKSQQALMEIIAQAPANGLNPTLFLKQPLPADPTRREAALTKAALGYASALARGYSDPTKFGNVYTIPRPKPDIAAGLAKALESGDLPAWFASLPPRTDEYRAISRAHLRYLELAGKTKPPPIPAGKPIEPGRSDPRVPLVAAALTAHGYLAPPQAQQPQPQPSERYAPDIGAAVRRLQSDFGLKPDGVIGEQTLDLLNAGPAGLARQSAIALERLRWLDRDPPATRIDVNSAAAFFDYYRGGRRIDRRRVVVGEPGWETPQLQSPMVHLVANPLWRVPDSIIEDELSKKSGAYLARNGFEWREGRLVQRSGPKNSLGQVKFDLQNKHSIYLHDTPAKPLFALPERHKSHGCVRVENALDFAALLAGQDGLLEEYLEALKSRDESYVKLKTKIPVRLLYHTAFFDGGRVQFRPDVYGWDDQVARALGLVRGPPRKPHRHQPADLGP